MKLLPLLGAVAFYGLPNVTTFDNGPLIERAMANLGVGQFLSMTTGATYYVKNVRLPNFSDLKARYYGAAAGEVTIKRMSGGDTDYMVAPERWLTANANKAFASSPMNPVGILFDGSNIAKYPLVIKNYQQIHERVQVIGATSAGSNWCFTRQNQDASDGTTGFLSACIFDRCKFAGQTSDTAGTGFISLGLAGSPNEGPTDASMLACEVYNVATGIYLSNQVGWIIQGCFTYTHATAAIRIRMFSSKSPGSIEGNIVDGTFAFVIDGVNCAYGPCRLGQNTIYNPCRVTFSANSNNEVFIVDNPTMTVDQPTAAVASYWEHMTDRSQKMLIMDRGNVSTTTPVRLASGNTNGVIKWRSVTGPSLTSPYLTDL